MPLLSRCVAASVWFSAVFLFAADAPKKSVTVDDVAKQSPGSTGLSAVWAPDGRSFVYRREGAIHRYDAATQKSKEWIALSKLEQSATKTDSGKPFNWQNRRVSAESLQWLPNGKDLLVETSGDLFVLHENGKFEQITSTGFVEEDPKLSPDGKRILYRHESDLYVVDIATQQVKRLTSDGSATLFNGKLDWVYPEELELGTASWWSPDSRQIAFLQFDVSNEFVYPQADLLGERARAEPERYPQAGTNNAQVKLGVLSLATGQTRWMNVGETANTLLARVIWLPDSSQLAVERLSRIQNQLDLLFCNPESGAARTILREDSKTWINFTDNLVFLKGRPEFLWTSEHENGFRHLYRYQNNGELVMRLTSGDWEVKRISAVDETAGKVYFTSNEPSPLETHYYSVALAGGARTRLTPDDGVHRVQTGGQGEFFLDSFSNAAQPSSQTLRNASGTALAVLREPDFKPSSSFVLLPSEMVSVPGPGGITFYGRLTKPVNYQAGIRYPLVVSVYGGPGVQTVLNDWQGVNMTQALAQNGYLVWQMDNRGSSGRGHRFEEPIFRELGTREVADQKLGVEYLVKQGLADPERVGIFGWSYGGYMTIHSMLLAPDVFRAGVSGAPVTDWHNYDTIYTERYMDTPDNNTEHYGISSNVKNAAKLRGHLLILHNFEDDNVLFQNTLQMAEALEREGKLFFMQVYPQKAHGVSGEYRAGLLRAQMAFFDEYLKKKN